MQINLSFDSLAELQEFASWAAQRGQYTETRAGDLVHIVDTRPVTAEGAVIPVEPQDAEQLASAGAGEAPSIDPVPEVTPKRKRRTKAEIAADEAAAKAAQESDAGTIIDKGEGTAAFADGEGGEVTHVAVVDNSPDPAATVTTIQPEIFALAATIDGADKMAHMNEGRDFIAKHGFPKYNETFALADVPSNIAAHTPEQAALHRAAMQWLIAQAG